MKYGDFANLVQLGVGLHVGTALLHLYGEVGVQPLVRTIARLKSLFDEVSVDEPPSPQIKDELDELESRYEIFKIQLFNEYKKYIAINSCVAAILIAILIVLTYKADDPISSEWILVTVLICSISTLPAPITLGVLWADAARKIKPIKERADALESRAIRASRSRTRSSVSPRSTPTNDVCG